MDPIRGIPESLIWLWKMHLHQLLSYNNETRLPFSELIECLQAILNDAECRHKFCQNLKVSATALFLIVEDFSNGLNDFCSQQDCFAVPGKLMSLLQVGAQLREVYNGLLSKNIAELKNGTMEDLDGEFWRYIKYWTGSLAKRATPRPAHYGQLAQVSLMRNVYLEVAATLPIQLVYPKIDTLIHTSLGTYGRTLIDQIVDNTLSGISRTYDEYLLIGDKEHLMSSMSHCLTIHSSRLRMHNRCLRIIKRSALVCSELIAPSEESLCLFVNFLSNSELFRMNYEDDGKIEFISTTLYHDPKRKRLFLEAGCDRSFILSDDFWITIKLKEPRGHILVESRQAWIKDKWVTKISQAFGLIVVKLRATNEVLDKWVKQVRFRFEALSFCSFWALQIMKNEDILDMNPKFTLGTYYNACVYASENLLNPMGEVAPTEHALWIVTMKHFANWLDAMVSQFNAFIKDWRMPIYCLNWISRLLQLWPLKDVGTLSTLSTALLNLEASIPRLDAADSDKNIATMVGHLVAYCKSLCLDRSITLSGQGSSSLLCPNTIGMGSFGHVYRCFDADLGLVVAIKELACVDPNVLASEVGYIKYIRHRNVVEFYDAVVVGQVVYLKMELCDGGSLKNLIKLGHQPTDKEFKEIAGQLVLGLSFLHASQLVHGDLKPGNILLDPFGTLKLADFGTAYCISEGKRTKGISGTILYTAPEIILGGEMSFQADIWSVGCTLFHLATGVSPWNGAQSPWNIMLNVSKGVSFDLTPLYKCQIDQRAKSMVASCLEFDPDRRPNITQLMLEEYFLNDSASIL